jgi:hypothetical protein
VSVRPAQPVCLQHIGHRHRFKACIFRYGSECYIRGMMADLEDQTGTVRPGLVADLLLLRANPLADIENTRAIEAVVLRGRLLQRAELDSILGG